MKRFVWIFSFVISAITIGAVLVHLRTVSAQNGFSAKWTPAPPSTQPPGTIYNPYPPGILPADLVSEIERVRSEVNFIEAEAIAQWKALTPPTYTGQPPTIQGNG